MLDKIGHYSLTNPTTVYDEEAMTALELAGRTAAKVNEAVDAFNNLETNTKNRLSAQDVNISARLNTQDTAIRKMSDETMPAAVEAEMQARVNDGTFSKDIDKYMGGLNARVNNLLGSVPEGGTSMDAEVIAARMSSDNVVWQTLESNLRGNIGLAVKASMAANAFTFEAAAPTKTEAGYYGTDGVFVANSTYIARSYSVNPGEVYLCDSQYYQVFSDAILFDASGNVVMNYHTVPAGTTYLINEYQMPIIIPDNGYKLIVNSQTNHQGALKRIVGYETPVNNEHNNNMMRALFNSVPAYTTEIQGTLHTGFVLGGTKRDLVPIDQSKYNVMEAPVESGAVIKVTADAAYGNYAWIFKDNAGNLEYGPVCTTAMSFDEVMVVPRGATRIFAAASKGNARVEKVESFAVPGVMSHLKWACIGDSITEANSRTTHNYHDYIHDRCKIQVYNMGVSSTGFKRGETDGNSYLDRVASIPNDVDLITIMCSGNDLNEELGTPSDNSTETVLGCVNKTLAGISAKFPLVPLGVIATIPWGNYNPVYSTNKMAQYTQGVKQICENRGIPFLDLYHSSGLRPWDNNFLAKAYTRDDGNNVHPDENGHKLFAPKVYAFIQSLVSTY